MKTITIAMFVLALTALPAPAREASGATKISGDVNLITLGVTGQTAETTSLMTCSKTAEEVCNGWCIDQAFFQGRVLSRSTCEWTNRLELRCGCVWEPLGPYIPQCYYNCGGRISTAVGY